MSNESGQPIAEETPELESVTHHKQWFETIADEEFSGGRMRVMQDEMLENEEKVEMMRVFDRQRAHQVATDDQGYVAYEQELRETQMEVALRNYARDYLLKAFTGKDEVYNIQPNTRILIPQKYAVFGISGEVIFDSTEIDDAGERTYDFRIIVENEKGFGSSEYSGSLVVNDIKKIVRTVVLGDAIDMVDPSIYRKFEKSPAQLRALPQIGLGSLVRVPDIAQVPYQGGRSDIEPSQSEYGSDGYTPLHEEITSTVLYRRRTFHPSDDYETIIGKITSLMDSFSAETYAVLKEYSGGEVKFNLYVGNENSVGEQSSRAVHFGDPSTFSEQNTGDLMRWIQEVFEGGADQVILVPVGARVPRELENLPKRRSPTPHTRRGRSRTVLVTGEVPQEIAVIRKKITYGEEVTMEELEQFSGYTEIPIEKLKEILRENARTVSGTIFSADAELLGDKNRYSGLEHRYVKRVA